MQLRVPRPVGARRPVEAGAKVLMAGGIRAYTCECRAMHFMGMTALKLKDGSGREHPVRYGPVQAAVAKLRVDRRLGLFNTEQLTAGIMWAQNKCGGRKVMVFCWVDVVLLVCVPVSSRWRPWGPC